MPATQPRPLPNSYWATPQLLASEYPGAPTANVAASRLDALLAAGIRDFYDLTEAREPLQPYATLLVERAKLLGLAPDEVRYQRLPIRDAGLPSAERLEEVLHALANSAAAGRKAVVHCWGGIGRTGTVVGCHLVRQLGLSGEQALARISEEWQTVEKAHRQPKSPETAGQVAFVKSFGKKKK